MSPPLRVPELPAARQAWTAPASMGCAAHDLEDHRPMPTYVDLHHVVPRAWQRFWWPNWNNGDLRSQTRMGPVPRGGHYPKKEIWDERVEPLPPTCHGNVHFWLVRFMKQRAGLPVSPAPRGGEGEKRIARLAMTRWEEHGGDLDALCEAGLYGYG